MEDGDDGFGGDRRESFHQNEAISAVVDEGFLGEEDDDYDDLYNDVNVGDGFLQSLQRNDASQGFKADEKPEDRRMEEPVGVEAVRKSSSAAAGSIPGLVPGDGRVEKDPPLAMDGAPKVYPGSQYQMAEGVTKGPHQTDPVGGMRFEMTQAPSRMPADVGSQINNRMQPNPGGNDNYERLPGFPPSGNNINVGNVNGVGIGGGSSGGGGTILFVGELHWWTTDAELESELSKYGQVKEVKFFDEKASGKSKGYCQVEFYDTGAAAACKEGMNGHVFNGRACVVAFASPYTVRKMGEAQVNKNQAMIQSTPQQGGRRGPGPGDMSGNGRGNVISIGSNYQGGDQGRNFGRGNWGRGGGMANRGQMVPMRNRMGMGGRGMMGNNGSGFGQGIGTATPPLLHPQTMMGQGFDPSYAAMGRMGGYGGFPGGPTPPFSGMMPSFPPVGGMGMPGVAPHVNPAFFGRGMPANGMGMMHVSGVEVSGMGMWSDPNMAGWGGEEQGGRAGESSYGEDATSEHQYGEGSRERGGWQNPAKDKDRTSERDLSSGGPERRYRDDREPGWERGEKEADPPSHGWTNRRHDDDGEMEWDRGRGRDRESDREQERDRDRGRERDRGRDDRDRYREERDRLSDHHRHKDRYLDQDDDWDRRRSSRNRSKSRMSQEEEQHHRSREVDHGKRRRLPSE